LCITICAFPTLKGVSSTFAELPGILGAKLPHAQVAFIFTPPLVHIANTTGASALGRILTGLQQRGGRNVSTNGDSAAAAPHPAMSARNGHAAPADVSNIPFNGVSPPTASEEVLPERLDFMDVVRLPLPLPTAIAARRSSRYEMLQQDRDSRGDNWGATTRSAGMRTLHRDQSMGGYGEPHDVVIHHKQLGFGITSLDGDGGILRITEIRPS
jgi:hypothetical protein